MTDKTEEAVAKIIGDTDPEFRKTKAVIKVVIKAHTECLMSPDNGARFDMYAALEGYKHSGITVDRTWQAMLSAQEKTP